MATNRSFQNMLNEYLPNELLKEELIKRDYLLTKIDKDEGWVGGNLVVPFKAAGASSIAFGQLSASTDIAPDNYVRGGIPSQKECWGTMIFNHRDLMEHEAVSEKNLLKILPDTVNDFMEYMKNVVSVNLLNGPWFATLTADATASNGQMLVDRPDRFVIGQKVVVDDSTLTPVTGYVSQIDINTVTANSVGIVTLTTTRYGSTTVDFSASTKTVANTARVYNDGQEQNGFSDLRSALLSAANGGSATLYGVTKLLYPYLQAINISGTDMTSANIVEKCFNAYTQTRRLGKGLPKDILVSYKNMGYIMAVVEASKGGYRVSEGSGKASQYGWDEIEIGSVTGHKLKFVAIQEMSEDVIMLMDFRGLKFYSNGFFKKRKSPDGIEYFEIRAQTGFQYLIDICLFGDLVLQRPSYCGIIYGINIQ